MIYGTDTAGVEWTGNPLLDVDADGKVFGTIRWSSSSGLLVTAVWRRSKELSSERIYSCTGCM